MFDPAEEQEDEQINSMFQASAEEDNSLADIPAPAPEPEGPELRPAPRYKTDAELHNDPEWADLSERLYNNMHQWRKNDLGKMSDFSQIMMAGPMAPVIGLAKYTANKFGSSDPEPKTPREKSVWLMERLGEYNVGTGNFLVDQASMARMPESTVRDFFTAKDMYERLDLNERAFYHGVQTVLKDPATYLGMVPILQTPKWLAKMYPAMKGAAQHSSWGKTMFNAVDNAAQVAAKRPGVQKAAEFGKYYAAPAVTGGVENAAIEYQQALGEEYLKKFKLDEEFDFSAPATRGGEAFISGSLMAFALNSIFRFGGRHAHRQVNEMIKALDDDAARKADNTDPNTPDAPEAKQAAPGAPRTLEENPNYLLEAPAEPEFGGSLAAPQNDLQYLDRPMYRGYSDRTPERTHSRMAPSMTDSPDAAATYGRRMASYDAKPHGTHNEGRSVVFMGDRETGRLATEMTLGEVKQKMIDEYLINNGTAPEREAEMAEQVLKWIDDKPSWRRLVEDYNGDMDTPIPLDDIMTRRDLSDVLRTVADDGAAWRSRVEGIPDEASGTSSYDPTDKTVVSFASRYDSTPAVADVNQVIPPVPTFGQLEARFRQANGVPMNVVTRGSDGSWIAPKDNPFADVGGDLIRPYKVTWRDNRSGGDPMFATFRRREDAKHLEAQLFALNAEGNDIDIGFFDETGDYTNVAKPWMQWQIKTPEGELIAETPDTYWAQELMIQNPDAIVTNNYDLETQHLHSLHMYSSFENFMLNSKKLQANKNGEVNVKMLYEGLYDTKTGAFKGGSWDQAYGIKQSDADLYELDKYLNGLMQELEDRPGKTKYWVPKKDIIDYARTRYQPVERRTYNEQVKYRHNGEPWRIQETAAGSSRGSIIRAEQYEDRFGIMEPENEDLYDGEGSAGVYDEEQGDYLYRVDFRQEVDEYYFVEMMQEDFDNSGQREDYINDRYTESLEFYEDEIEQGLITKDQIKADIEEEADSYAQSWYDDAYEHDIEQMASDMGWLDFRWDDTEGNSGSSNDFYDVQSEAQDAFDEWMNHGIEPNEMSDWGVNGPELLEDTGDVVGKLGHPDLKVEAKGEKTVKEHHSFIAYSPDLRGEYGPRKIMTYYSKDPSGSFGLGRETSGSHYSWEPSRDGVQIGHARAQVADVLMADGTNFQYYYYLHEIQSDFHQEAGKSWYRGRALAKNHKKAKATMDKIPAAMRVYNDIMENYGHVIEQGESVTRALPEVKIDGINMRFREDAGIKDDLPYFPDDYSGFSYLYPKQGPISPALEDKLVNFNRQLRQIDIGLSDLNTLGNTDAAYADVPFKDNYYHVIGTDQLRSALVNNTNGFAMSRGAAHYMGQNPSGSNTFYMWDYDPTTDNLVVMKQGSEYGGQQYKQGDFYSTAIVDHYGASNPLTSQILTEHRKMYPQDADTVYKGQGMGMRSRLADKIRVTLADNSKQNAKKKASFVDGIVEGMQAGKTSGFTMLRGGMHISYDIKYKAALESALKEAGIPKKFATLKEGEVVPQHYEFAAPTAHLLVWTDGGPKGPIRVTRVEPDDVAETIDNLVASGAVGDKKYVDVIKPSKVSQRPKVSYIQFKDEEGNWVHESFGKLYDRLMAGEAVWKLPVGGAIAVGLTAAERAEQENNDGGS